jgi:hypothetical protein
VSSGTCYFMRFMLGTCCSRLYDFKASAAGGERPAVFTFQDLVSIVSPTLAPT